jgi:YD repeat-containing protein
MDVYSEPFSKESYYDVLDRDAGNKGNNLLFPNYDSYLVAAQGMGGTMTPRIYDFGTLLAPGRIINRFALNIPQEEIVFSNDGNTLPSFDKIQFGFDGEHNSYMRVAPGAYSFPSGTTNPVSLKTYSAGSLNTTSPDGLSNYNSSSNRYISGRHVQWFTNKEIRTGIAKEGGSVKARGFIDDADISALRSASPGQFQDDGIGGFTITAEDGKTYHYTLPVYQYEQYYKNVLNVTTPSDKFFEQKKLTPYAYSWLLTSITGPDFVDRNSNGHIDDDDWGYWVRFKYGKWTDGYIWGNPHTGYETDPLNPSKAFYTWGRKQVYYLDAIKTRTHSAYFIKDLRLDSRGIEIASGSSKSSQVLDQYPLAYSYVLDKDWTWDNPTLLGEKWIPERRLHVIKISHTATIVAPPQPLLALKKILIVPNSEPAPSHVNSTNLVSSAGATGSIYFNSNLTVYSTYNTPSDNGKLPGGGTEPYNWNLHRNNHNVTFSTRLQDNILDMHDNISGIESKAIQKIEFDYNYNLTANTPGSYAPGGGKLTLNEVTFKGSGNSVLIPSYRFEYYSTNAYDKEDVDDWGFCKTNPYNASIRTITTPLGSKLTVNYSSDTYTKEAVFNNIIYRFKVSSIQKSPTNNNVVILTINPAGNTGWASWFAPGQKYPFEYLHHYYINPPPAAGPVSQKNRFYQDMTLLTINTITNQLIFQIDDPSNLVRPSDAFTITQDAHITGNVSRVDQGGLRVSSLKAEDEFGNAYTTTYNYLNPLTGNESGITSYAPKPYDQFVPFINEVPGPGVMYEYVTVAKQGPNSKFIDKVRFQFNVIKPVSGSATYGLKLGDQFETEDLQSDYGAGNAAYTSDPIPPFSNNQVFIKARSATVKNNLASLGRLVSRVHLSPTNQATASAFYSYYSPSALKAGIFQETFQYVKRFSYYKHPGHAAYDHYWYITSSSRINYPSVLKQVVEKTKGQTTVTTFGDQGLTNNGFDVNTSKALNIKRSTGYGETYIYRNVPAYEKYSAMGSKATNINNKNMMSQETESYTYVEDPADNQTKLVSASVQTWKNSWNYRTLNTSANSYEDVSTTDVWRKHRQYVWKSLINTDASIPDFTAFNHTTGAAGISKWRKIAEVNRYDHYSKPLETTDVNGNYSTVKTGYKESFVIAEANNTSFTEAAYSGAEDQLPGTYFFGGEVQIGTASTEVSSDFTHTGSRSLKTPYNNTAFYYRIPILSLMKGRQYRASVWIYESNASAGRLAYYLRRADQSVAGTGVASVSSPSAKTAGNWKLVSLDIDIPLATDAVFLEITTYNAVASGSYVYFDDFRFHPRNAGMRSYVYDPETSLITAILDKENFTTRFTYDTAGRLTKTERETLQGFKTVSEKSYHYGRN